MIKAMGFLFVLFSGTALGVVVTVAWTGDLHKIVDRAPDLIGTPANASNNCTVIYKTPGPKAGILK